MSNDRDESASKSRGKLVVVSGPSGAGKTSICEALRDRMDSTVWSVSVTTRQRRGTEKPGHSYEFVTREVFAEKEAAGEFLESAEYIGQCYGTPRGPVEAALAEGKNVVLEIDVQGGMQVAAAMPESIRIFILPPSMAALRSRLEGRNTEADSQLARRLAQAEGEITTARSSGCYQYFIVNDSLDESIQRVEEIIAKEKQVV